MTVSAQVSDRTYYDNFPDGTFQTGDIWINVPNNGILEDIRTAALLITPACDLQNRKTDTLSFVPIVSLRRAVKMRFLLRTLAADMKQLVDHLAPELSDICDFGDFEFRAELRAKVKDGSARPGKAARKIEQLQQWLEFCESESLPDGLQLPFLSERQRGDLLGRLVRNAYSADVHFLPRERTANSLALPEHGICLFRYVQTFPVEIFELAHRSSEAAWPTRITSEIPSFGNVFRDRLPIRALRLKHSFCVDLVTRFTSLFNRIGSVDFTEQCVADFLAEL